MMILLGIILLVIGILSGICIIPNTRNRMIHTINCACNISGAIVIFLFIL